MRENSRFVLAVHTLTLLAEMGKPTSSAMIAMSAGVNAVTVRKLVGQLRMARLVKTQIGAKGGTILARDPSEITLKDIFLAVRDDSLFGAYPENPSDQCPVGQHLRPTLNSFLEEPTRRMVEALAETTIKDVQNEVCEHAISAVEPKG